MIMTTFSIVMWSRRN